MGMNAVDVHKKSRRERAVPHIKTSGRICRNSMSPLGQEVHNICVSSLTLQTVLDLTP